MSTPNPYEMSITSNRRVLEARKVGTYFAESLRYGTAPEPVMDTLKHRLEAYVLADHIADDSYVGHTQAQWPETTWQMFKHRHAESWWLAWLVRRRPVRMHVERQQVEVRVARYLTYPQATISSPSLGRPVIYEDVQVTP